jgi:hypothetical protein
MNEYIFLNVPTRNEGGITTRHFFAIVGTLCDGVPL